MSERPSPSAAELAQENEVLRQRLLEAEELISAIRTGAIDALAIQAAEGPRVFTLEGADQSYRTLIEQMNEGALLLSQDGSVLYANAALVALLGTPLEQLIGTAFSRFVPTDAHAQWQRLLAAGWLDKSHGELPLRTLRGQVQPYALALNMLTFGRTPVLAMVVSDVSAQREIIDIRAQVAAQNALLASKNEELRAQTQARHLVEQAAAETSRILEGIPHIAWTANPAGQPTYLNRRWFDYCGEESAPTPTEGAAQVMGRLHPQDVAAVAEHWQRSLRDGVPLEMECRLRSATGDYRWMLARALPSRNEQGAIIQWIGAYTDIHELKLAQQRVTETQHQLRENNEQLTRINRDLDNFIYTASHDLKAPINNIEGLLQALLLELPAELTASEAVQPILTMMQQSVDRFKRTIEHLTEVIKLQKEHEQPPALVDLAVVIHEVCLDLAPLLQASAAQLEVDVEACPLISFSEKNLRSVVYNLLSNALKYRAPGRVPHVQVQCRHEAEYTVLVVQDNGLGLNANHAQKLFSMFQRFHDHVEGSGIGLYMVKRIVENAGGRIEVASKVGVGSTFSVYFRRENA